MTQSEVLYEVADGVAVISMNRPEAFNAITPEMITAMIEAFDESDRDDDVRAVVVTGTGRAFCAGADLSAGADTFSFPDDHRDSGGIFTLRVMRSLKPVIAAINGHAIGFGASMVLPMDFRIVAEDAKLGFVFGARGIVPDGASSWFLPKIVGLPTALDWCLTGRRFDADEALRVGLVQQALPASDVMDAAFAIAHSIRDQVAPISAVLTRQLLWQNAGAPDPKAAHAIESAALALTGSGIDAQEGVAAFSERRNPTWRQRFTEDAPDWFPWFSQDDDG